MRRKRVSTRSRPRGRAAIGRSRKWRQLAPGPQSDPPGAAAAFDAVAGDAAIDPLLRDAPRLRAALIRANIPGEEQKGEAELTALSAAGDLFGAWPRLDLAALGVGEEGL